jgi:thiamine-monophosphate kinase
MHEFALIDHIKTRSTTARPEILLGIGDDCALIQTGTKTLAISTDTLVENTHFFPGTSARAIGHKALAVNLSDLAAMGAKPLWFLLNLSLPESSLDFVSELTDGIQALASEHQCVLIGGDTTRGPLSITITVLGECQPEQALRRDGAQIDDLVFVSGNLGAAACAVHARKMGLPTNADLDRALDWPQARVQLGLALRGIATAAIDLSDGLVNDLVHICERSGVSARLNADAIPIARTLRDLAAEQALQFAVNGGDDYELCFCAPPHSRDALHAISKMLDLDLHEIGIIQAQGTDSRPVSLWHDGVEIEAAKGFQHF